MTLRWRVKRARGITEMTEQTEENTQTVREAEAVTFGIGLAQTQHSRMCLFFKDYQIVRGSWK